ncbi:MAG: glycosyltransferase family 39 protein [Vicinamibacterales bacterium]
MAWMDRHAWWLFGVFSVAFFVAAASHAAARPLWHDEIVTLIVAGQPSLRDVGAALIDGADFQPPLNTLLVRWVTAVAGTGPVQARLPAMAGVWIGCAALFAMVRRRSHALLAVAAACLVAETAVFRFAYESRGYGLLFGCTAVAVWAWTEAAAGRRRRVTLPVLAGAAALMMWTHYYAVLILPPLAGAEAVRWYRSRVLDAGVATAVVAGLLAIAPLWPVTAGALARSATFWARAAPLDPVGAYRFVLGPLLDPWLLIALGLALIVGIGAAVVAASGKAARLPRLAHPLPLHETVFLIVGLTMPLIGLALGRFAGGFTPRYGLAVIVVVALAVTMGAWQMSRRRARVDLIVVGALVAAFAMSVADARSPERATFVDPCGIRPALRDELAAGRTVAVTGGLTFAQLWYYCPAETRESIVYAADPDEAARLSGTDTLDRGLQVLSRWAPMTVLSYEGLLARGDAFDVYSYGSGWLLDRVERDERLVVERVPRDDPGARIFNVRKR